MGHPNIFPALRYRDCPAAIEWLCEVLGFKKYVVYEDKGIVHHAELTHGEGMIMLGSSGKAEYDKLIQHPIDADYLNTQSPYIFVDNLDLHYQHAIKNGAEIVLPLKKDPHGSGYTCRDPEGHLWSFGDFNPWNQNPS